LASIFSKTTAQQYFAVISMQRAFEEKEKKVNKNSNK